MGEGHYRFGTKRDADSVAYDTIDQFVMEAAGLKEVRPCRPIDSVCLSDNRFCHKKLNKNRQFLFCSFHRLQLPIVKLHGR